DTGTLALPRLEVGEMAARVLADRAQLVELRIVAFRDDAAVADQHRRRFDDRPREERALRLVLAALLRKPSETRFAVRGDGERVDSGLHPRNAREAVAELREIAGPRGAEGDARQDPLEIAYLGKHVANPARLDRIEQRRNGLLPCGKLAPIANRPAQPAPRQPAPHRCRAAVYDAGERELRAAAEARLDLEVAPRRAVHDQRVVAPLAREALQMRHLRALRLLHVLHEAARG